MIYTDVVKIQNTMMIGILFFVLYLCYLIQIIFNFFLRNILVKENFLGILALVLFTTYMITTNMEVGLVIANWIVIISNILKVMDLDLLKF